MKIEKETNEVRNEFAQKLDTQVAEVASGVRGLRAQVDQLYESGVPLNRHEVMELVKNVVEQRASESTSKSFSLEDVRSVARKIVMSELEKHAADGIGRTDYALASGGGRVVDHSEGVFLGRGQQWSSLMFGHIVPGGTRKHPLAQKVLQPSFGQPGECLPLRGSNVFLEISLRTAIRPDAVTLEHVAKVIYQSPVSPTFYHNEAKYVDSNQTLFRHCGVMYIVIYLSLTRGLNMMRKYQSVPECIITEASSNA